MPTKLSDLVSKYNGFTAPEYQVKINNTNLTEKYILSDFKMELTADYEASSMSFSIKNCFEGSKGHTSEMDSSLTSVIKPGNTAEASIGYAKSEKTELFKGYVDNVYIDYEGADTFDITVECLDAKGVMMSSRRSEVKKDIKKHSEAVKNIFDLYSKFITKQSITASPQTAIIEQHNESDYNFVVRSAKKINYCFYIINGEAFFQPKGKSQQSVLTIKKSDMIKSFSLHTSLKNAVWEVVVRTNNEKEPSKPFEGKADTYKNILNGSSVSVNNPNTIPKKVTRTYIDHMAKSNEEAKALAEARLTELSYFNVHAKLECVGIPDLVPGKVIDIDGFGKPCDAKYYIKKTTHIIDETGYVTKCELGGTNQ